MSEDFLEVLDYLLDKISECIVQEFPLTSPERHNALVAVNNLSTALADLVNLDQHAELLEFEVL